MTGLRSKDYQGPAILSIGFRPFFLLGALFTGLSMLAWLPQFYGELQLATAFSPVDWHIHELLFGYLAAIVTGFLLTAIPNWTGRLPVQGVTLLVLLLVWLAGRFAIAASGLIGWFMAMLIDGAFLATVVLAVAREIIAGRNWRNLKVLLPLFVLFLANVSFHLEAHSNGLSDYSRRLALAVAIGFIMLIGGRIIPSFTRNWLVRENPGRLPAPFDQFDLLSIAVSVAALTAWIASPPSNLSGALLAFAAALQFARLARWAGVRAFREPLVLVLHIGYGFIPIGFALLSAAQFWPAISPVAGVHALGAGAIGTMTLAVMVRATLGHTGQQLHAGMAVKLLFASVLVSTLVRIAESLGTEPQGPLLQMSAIAWFVAFTGFGVVFGPAVMRKRAT